MEEIKTGRETLSRTQQNMLDYFATHDVKYISDDAVFRHMHSGETYRGKAEVGAMLHYIYHVAFDARVETSNYIITEDKAVVEGLFRGRHIGEFQGVQPTQREVSVPLTVTYSLENGLIREARIYMATDVMREQLGMTAAQPKTAYVTRDIFYLKYGHYREVKALFDEAVKSGLMPNAQNQRLLTDFTGDAYRVIMEEGFNSLEEFEKALSSELHRDEWQRWYHRFIEHVDHGSREILKQIM